MSPGGFDSTGTGFSGEIGASVGECDADPDDEDFGCTTETGPDPADEEVPHADRNDMVTTSPTPRRL